MTVQARVPLFPDGDLATRLHFGRFASDALADLVTGPWTLVTSEGGLGRAKAAGLFARLSEPYAIVIVPSGLLSLGGLTKAWSPGPAQVLGVGAGSVLDAAKLVRLANITGAFPADPGDWTGVRNEIDTPLICVPTTAGSGSELTPTASHWKDRIKSSLDGPGLCPSDAVYDPALLASAGEDIKTAALWDAASHALEALWSRRATEESDRYATFALAMITRALARSGRVTDHILPALSVASAAAGAAITTTRTGIAHALSYPLTGRHGVRHGFAAGLYAVAVAHLLPELAPERARQIEEALGPLANLSSLWHASGASHFVASCLSGEHICSETGMALDPSRASLSVVPPEAAVVREIRRRAAGLATPP